MNYAIIHKKEVINRVIWDGETKFNYPFSYDEMIQSDDLQIGMKLINGVWIFEEVLDVTE